jgi:hypothetical protein
MVVQIFSRMVGRLALRATGVDYYCFFSYNACTFSVITTTLVIFVIRDTKRAYSTTRWSELLVCDYSCHMHPLPNLHKLHTRQRW